MSNLKSCGFLIYRTDPTHSFLLMRHPTRWDLPKGNMDQGETDLQCALRELFEETGITGADVRVDPEFRYVSHYTIQRSEGESSRDWKELVIFLARLIRPVSIQLTEHDDYRWFDWNPPHRIQVRTIDPVLAHLHDHWRSRNAS